MAAPSVSVIIATLGESHLLPKTLEEVRHQADALGAEVVVIVNASEARSKYIGAHEWTHLADRVLFEERPGKSHALNRGIQEARGDILAFTDDDAIPGPGWLEEITKPFGPAGPVLVGTGGRVQPIYPNGQPPEWYRILLHPNRRDLFVRCHSFLGPCHDLGSEARTYIFHPEKFVVPLGVNCAYRREALLKRGYQPHLGPNRATGLRGGEDTELGVDFLRSGRSILYCPKAEVYHPVTPERMTFEYVRHGYFLRGVENVRIRHALGLPPVKTAESGRKLFSQVLRYFWFSARLNPKRHRAYMHSCYRFGVLWESFRKAMKANQDC